MNTREGLRIAAETLTGVTLTVGTIVLLVLPVLIALH